MPELTLESLAERVKAIEAQLAKLRRQERQATRPKDWRRTIGMFAGDEVMKQIFEAAKEIREAERREFRE